MYDHALHQQVNKTVQNNGMDMGGKDMLFHTRFIANATAIHALYMDLYGSHPQSAAMFSSLLQSITTAYSSRTPALRLRDEQKETTTHWFLSNAITGMSLYVDRFCGNIKNLAGKLGYFKRLGVNFLHLMPVFQSPAGESDGGYAVSDFRQVDERFGTLADLQALQQRMKEENMYLMIDIVLNHTSHRHAWAQKAKEGDAAYQQHFYMYDDRTVPDVFDASMPDIFPESSPGNFTWVAACRKWVMTVFHQYQWDLNYTNPAVFVAMLENIFFYANMGVDVLRIDAPAFIWKEAGTTCQNLPQAHTILRLIRQCVQVAAPGMALLGEAIVAPAEIMKYFGNGLYTARECDLAYNATHMALQWDALATGDTRVMLAAQSQLSQKPYGTSWITYTRCHDDIGLGYDDYMIEEAGFNPYAHRRFLKEYYSGSWPGSPAKGALFSVNPKTQDARISGSLASLCGLEKALHQQDDHEKETAVNRILLMQAHSFFMGGIPMIFYGDELGYTNDYAYLKDHSKSYDNRWMHRPVMDWVRNQNIDIAGTPEQVLFSATQRLITLRKKLAVVGDYKNITWLSTQQPRVAGYLRTRQEKRLFCLFNFSAETVELSWYVCRLHGHAPLRLYNHWTDELMHVGRDDEHLVIKPYSFLLLEPA